MSLSVSVRFIRKDTMFSVHFTHPAPPAARFLRKYNKTEFTYYYYFS